MQTIAASLLILALGSQAAGAQDVRPFSHDHQVAACQAWRDQLRLTVRRYSDHGLLTTDDAAAVSGLIEFIGQRCPSDDAGRMSGLYAVLLGTLVDQRNQP